MDHINWFQDNRWTDLRVPLKPRQRHQGLLRRHGTEPRYNSARIIDGPIFAYHEHKWTDLRAPSEPHQWPRGVECSERVGYNVDGLEICA